MVREEKLAEHYHLAGLKTMPIKTQFGTLPDDMTRANMQAIAQEILLQLPGTARRKGGAGRRGRRVESGHCEVLRRAECEIADPQDA